MSKRFRIGITSFLWLTSSFLLLIFIGIGADYLTTMSDIANQATDLRERALPEIMENQRAFTNIESLRRIAEVVYVTDDAKRRREARITAQAMAAESVFTRGEKFHERAMRLSELINTLAKFRDASDKTGKGIQELARDYSQAILLMATYIPNIEVNRKIAQAYFATSMPLAGPTGISRDNVDKIMDLDRADKENMTFIAEQCEYYAAYFRALGPICARVREVNTEYDEQKALLLENFSRAREYWQIVDASLREARDSVGADSEFAIDTSLGAIESKAEREAWVSTWLMVGGTLAFLVYLTLLYWHIVRPVRWTGQKLMEIQQGVLHGTVPSIRISEMVEVAHLLDHFSGHLAELYSQAERLEEDAAEKNDLEELMRVVFQASLNGYCVWSQGTLIMANQGLLRLLEIHSMDELIRSKNLMDFPSRNEMESIYETVQDKGIHRSEVHLSTLGGRSLPCEVTYLPVYVQGKSCILSYFRDMREQKRTEEELRGAKEAAEAAVREKSDFLARMSHEIRTPMNGVLGLTQIALNHSPPPQQRNYLEKIQASARILLGVINDILDFSRIERGKVNLEQVNFCLTDMVGTVVDLFRGQAEQKGLYFRVETCPNLPSRVWGDELRLSQVLLNLCGNAVKFTERGGVTVRLEVQADYGEQVRLRISVSDTGVGMTDRQMAGLFQPFSQADTSTTRKYGGSGLGLMISKLLVEMMGGEIDMESIPGMGSEFGFAIILRKAPAAAESSCCVRLSDTPDQDSLAGKRILLVEDNEINQEIAVAFLKHMGIETLTASNGAEALEVLEHNDVDGVLMDIQMPVMDGLEASRRIRICERDTVRKLPIIAMTAHAMWEDRQKSLAAGMNDHITKPINADELCDKLSKLL
jgi:signal transduction histidine kinase/CheY-like chemotaxis protein